MITIRAAPTICGVANRRLPVHSNMRRWKEAIRSEQIPAYIEQLRLKKNDGCGLSSGEIACALFQTKRSDDRYD